MSKQTPEFIQKISEGMEFAKEEFINQNRPTLKDLRITVEPPSSKASGMCSIYENVDARISKDVVTFGPIAKNGEYLYQLKIETDMLRAIINYVDEELGG